MDKRLDGVQAVQTRSRLKRMLPGKDAPFVLDFVNRAVDADTAFKPLYDKTGLEKPSDPAQPETLKHELVRFQNDHRREIEAFARIFYKLPELRSPSDHARMERHLQPAVDRCKALDDEDQRTEFRDGLGAYLKLYASLSQIIPYADPEPEMLYSYGRLLLPHLPAGRDAVVIRTGDEVALQHYRLERVISGAIDCKGGEAR